MSSITQIKPKRTPNAYMLFLNENRSQIKAGLIAVGIDANKAKFVAQFAGAQWNQMSTEEQQPYIDEANTLKDEAQAQAYRLNAEAQAQAAALVNTTSEPVSIPPVVHTKETNTEETLRILHTDAVKISNRHFFMLYDLAEKLLQDYHAAFSEAVDDKQAEIDALQKRVQQLEEDKEKEKVAETETEINGAKLRLSSNATSEERKALHLLLKNKKLSIVLMQDDKEVDDLQLSL